MTQAKLILLAGLLTAFALMAAWGFYERSRYLSCKAESVRLEGELERQNAAVQALADESKRKTEDAAKRLLAARRATAGAQTEAERLRGLAGAPRAATATPSACQAGSAVVKIREGFK